MTDAEHCFIEASVAFRVISFNYVNDDDNRDQYVPRMNELREEQWDALEAVIKERGITPAWPLVQV